jgi:hypothetical protein
MHQYNVSTPFESIAIKVAGTYPYEKSILPEFHELLHPVAKGLRNS